MTKMQRARQSYDVVVIGGGQAGLAIGYFLTQQEKRFVILDAAASIGSAWRARWDSLVLFTPRRYDSLPGLPFPGDPDGYPTRDEVIAYLETYREKFALPLDLGSEVRAMTQGDGTFLLDLDGRTVEAGQVVVATGPFQTPRVPDFAGELAPEVFQTHSQGYRAPGDVPEGSVLVVGGGNTGYQIAGELSSTHHVHLAVGGRQKPLPQKLLGRDLFWWLVTTRLFKTSIDSRLGQKLSRRETLIGSSPGLLEKQGVKMKPRMTGASGGTASFSDGSDLSVDAVIWATGFSVDHSWIKLPIVDQDGTARHRRGVTDIPGLYFLGLPWQHTRGSALLGWVKEDAEYIAGRIGATSLQSEQQAPVAPRATATGAPA
jgi:putative flavoprotein involved in K+ transport